MKSSGLEVFDFSEEDELHDLSAEKFRKKFKNPSREDNAILKKYEFLGCVAQGTSIKREVVGTIPCVDVDAIDCDRNCDNDISSILPCTTEDGFAKNEGNSGLDAAPQSKSTIHGQPSYVKLDNHESRSFFPAPETGFSSPGPPSPKKSQINALSDSSPRVEPLDMMSDADECISESTTSSPSDVAEGTVSLNGQASGYCFGDLEMDQGNMAVILRPDYFIYRDNYCTEPLLSFSKSCIRATGSTAIGNQGTFHFEWGIDDILDIECQWFQGVDTIMVKLHVVSKDEVQSDNSTAGVEELKFAVVHPNWTEKQEQITSLNEKYLAIWDVVTDVDMDGDDLPARSYFPSFDEPFEEVVYPKGDVDAVSISKRDVDLLQPETFINDTIIDFYIKYLKNQIQSEGRHRFHFFNSFFFRKLADLDKDPSSASDGRAAFLRVRKWTRKVDLFRKDFIFIPVNYNLHWSLIVICHPGEVATFKDEDLDQSHIVPCILHMDSIKGSHAGLKNLVQSYLWEEWKERQMEMSEHISTKFLNLRFVELELPQQENSFDCGLFLLHYLELFLAEAPLRFNPFKINKFSAFLNVDWFPPAEASLKRALIQKLIFELLENRSRDVSSAACSDEDLPSKFPENKEKETCVEFISERCNAAVSSHGNFLGSQAGQGIEITLLAASSMRASQCVNDSGLVLRDLFEPGAPTGSLLGQYQSFDPAPSFYHLKGGMSTVEEDAETGEDFVLLPSEETGFGQMSRLASQDCSISYTSRGFTADTAWDQVICEQAKHEDVHSSLETSVCGSDDDDDDDIGIIEHCPMGKDVDLSQEEETDRQKSPSVENFECRIDSLARPSSEMAKTSADEGSQDLDNIHDNNEDQDHLLPAKDPASSEMAGIPPIDGSQNHEKIPDSSEDQDHLLPSKDPASSEMAKISPLDGSQNHEKIPDSSEDQDHLLPSRDPASSEVAKISRIDGSQNHEKIPDTSEDKDHLLPSRDPASSEMAKISPIDGSQNHEKIPDSSENGDHLSPKENPRVSSPHNSDLVESKLDQDDSKSENRNAACDNVETICDASELNIQQSAKRSDDLSELQGQQAVKRMRFTPHNEGDITLSGSLSNDLRL